MKLKSVFFSLLTTGLLVYAACTDPSTLGADLFEEDQTEIVFLDTLTLKASTVLGDSAITYRPNAATQLRNYLFGSLNDPLFGKTSASVFLQLRLAEFNPDFAGAQFDSVVLVLPYDSSRFYGKTNDIFGLEVLRVAEPFAEGVNYYSNQSLMTDPVPLGAKEFTPSLDTFTIRTFSTTGIDTVEVAQYLRVKLSDAFGQELLSRSAETFSSDTSFLQYLPGIQIKASKETEGLLSFLINSGETGVYLYYTRPDGGIRQYQMGLKSSSVRFAHFSQDYSGAPVEALIGSENAGEEVLFVQGLGGLRTRIELPYITNLKNVGINKAEIEIRVKTLPEDNPAQYEPLEQLVLLYKDEQNGFLPISDLEIASDPVFRLPLAEAFGGLYQAPKDNEPGLYRMNISTHLQEMIRGNRPKEIYIAAFRQTETAGRVAIFGATDAAYGVKINIAFTNL